ncbi:bis(5'-nucleosyl)-tetraphosphatase (symmetrical) YqeK [symbiont of Argiope bruennichi]|uniref:bis(5'-nucleosyl)-tetraphosphatase (symmetrical) YqeK n=1 Tax=symbiont of Argiope bruennichi TaxID=2810479 RepID=UPI003DA5AE40
MNTKKSILIFSGTFNPCHLGHLLLAKYLKECVFFDEMWIICQKNNPLKPISIVSIKKRIQMLKLLFLNFKKVKIIENLNYCEYDFFSDLIDKLTENFPLHEFDLAIGYDNYLNFFQWKNYQNIQNKIKNFYVLLRNINHKSLRNEEKNGLLKNFIFLNNYQFNISSSQIRIGKKINWLSNEVLNYINKNNLYIEDKINFLLSEYKITHTKNVTKYGLKLAKIHQVSESDTYAACMLHDICKSFKVSLMDDYLRKYGKHLLKEPFSVKHSRVACFYLYYQLKYNNLNVLNAIWKHTTASVKMSKLDMILYCADKLSDDRQFFEKKIFRKIVEKDLTLGFRCVLKYNLQEILKKNSIIKNFNLLEKKWNLSKIDM